MLPDSLSHIHISYDTFADMPATAAAVGTIDLAIVLALQTLSLAALPVFSALRLSDRCSMVQCFGRSDGHWARAVRDAVAERTRVAPVKRGRSCGLNRLALGQC